MNLPTANPALDADFVVVNSSIDAVDGQSSKFKELAIREFRDCSADVDDLSEDTP